MPLKETRLIEEIQKFWKVGIIAGAEELGLGSVNRIYRINADCGIFYLRCYKSKDCEVVRREHELIRFVTSLGLPAVSPAINEMKTSFVDIDGEFYALFFPASGYQIAKASLSIEHAHMAGDMLARLHKIVRPLPDLGYRRYLTRWNGPKWVERLKSLENIICNGSSIDAHGQDVIERLKEQQKWLADPQCPHEYSSCFPPQLIHGDFQHANVFFSSEGISGIIDWEQAAFMPRAFELVRAVDYMFDVKEDLTRAFIESYRAVLPMSKEEFLNGARMWSIMRDHYVWAIEEVYLNGNERARPFIQIPFRPFPLATLLSFYSRK